MPDDSVVDRSGLLERVRSLVPLIETAATQAEDERRPVDEVVDALADTGVFRSFVPARYGGFELDDDTFIDVGLAVSEACTSTGWITTFYMEHNWLLGDFPPAAQEEIFGQQRFVLAPASISPTGTAGLDDDGYHVSTSLQRTTAGSFSAWTPCRRPERRNKAAPSDSRGRR